MGQRDESVSLLRFVSPGTGESSVQIPNWDELGGCTVEGPFTRQQVINPHSGLGNKGNSKHLAPSIELPGSRKRGLEQANGGEDFDCWLPPAAMSAMFSRRPAGTTEKFQETRKADGST